MSAGSDPDLPERSFYFFKECMQDEAHPSIFILLSPECGAQQPVQYLEDAPLGFRGQRKAGTANPRSELRPDFRCLRRIQHLRCPAPCVITFCQPYTGRPFFKYSHLLFQRAFPSHSVNSKSVSSFSGGPSLPYFLSKSDRVSHSVCFPSPLPTTTRLPPTGVHTTC
ncbi:hypothetical protein VUR80DRAFT_6346 [Thermomyces stellatus]